MPSAPPPQARAGLRAEGQRVQEVQAQHGALHEDGLTEGRTSDRARARGRVGWLLSEDDAGHRRGHDWVGPVRAEEAVTVYQ
jgi:hypothetical protein